MNEAEENSRPPVFRKTTKKSIEERLVPHLLFLSALVSVLTMLAILGTLGIQAWNFFSEVPVWDFLAGTKWTPLFKPQHFGVLPLVSGTLLVTGISLVVAIPLGLGSAILLSEYASWRVRSILKPMLEILAGIPTVVYGYFALTLVTPLLQDFIPDVLVFNALSAGLVMGLMITPTVSSISEDALLAVPTIIREGAYALGASKSTVALRVVVPAAISGVLASIILGISRAIGETMLVTIAAGATPKLTFNPIDSIQTMTAYIAQLSLGETPYGTIEFNTIFAVGLLLFLMVLSVNIVSNWLIKRFRYEY